jgi:hypothetical protein
MAVTMNAQGAGMRITIAVHPKEPTIAKTRNPTTIARTTTGTRFHNLSIEEAEGEDCLFVSVMESFN